jgi:hypothetical protein
VGRLTRWVRSRCFRSSSGRVGDTGGSARASRPRRLTLTIEGSQPLCLDPGPYAAAVKIRSLDPCGQSRRARIRVNSVLARANNRAISLAVLGKRVGATTVECCGQRIMITCGMSGGLSSSTTMRSLLLILPAASALLGDDVVTAGSIPSRVRFGVRTPWRARLLGSRKPGPEVTQLDHRNRRRAPAAA